MTKIARLLEKLHVTCRFAESYGQPAMTSRLTLPLCEA